MVTRRARGRPSTDPSPGGVPVRGPAVPSGKSETGPLAARRLVLSVVLPGAPDAAIRDTLEALADALASRGIRVDPDRTGPMVQEGRPAGRLALVRDRRSAEILWTPGSWNRERAVRIVLTARRTADGTRLEVALRDPAPAWADAPDDAAAWLAGAVLAPLVASVSPAGQLDWHADRRARSPSGASARSVYRDPRYHWPNFLLILDRLKLTPSDHLLEIGCGGGAFLRKALESGCSAVGVDHAPAMVRLASELNGTSVADGRLRVLQGEATHLPVPDATFSCAVMTGVIGFLPDPVEVLREIRRALRPGGRLLVFGTTPALRGTPAAPEPMASRFYWHEAAAYGDMARAAGLVEVAVEEPSMERFARAARLPKEAVAFFRDAGGAVLLSARRGAGRS